MPRKPKTRIRIGLPKGAPNPNWFIMDMGYGTHQLQLGKDIVEAMKAKGYQADGQIATEETEDF